MMGEKKRPMKKAQPKKPVRDTAGPPRPAFIDRMVVKKPKETRS